MRRAFDRLYGKIKPGSVALVFFSGFGVQSSRQSYMIPVDAQIWTEAGRPPRRFQPRDRPGRDQQPRRRRQDRADRCLQAQPVRAPVPQLLRRACAGDRAERHAGDVFGGAVFGDLGQWRRPQPVRAGTAQGNPRSRPDGGGNAEPDPGRRHPRLAQRAGAVDFVLAGRGFFVHSRCGRRWPAPPERADDCKQSAAASGSGATRPAPAAL